MVQQVAFNVIFTEKAAAAVQLERGSGDAFQVEIQSFAQAGLFPVAGDLWSDDRISRHVFIIVSRMFVWNDRSGPCVQFLFDLPDMAPPPHQLSVVPPNEN